MLSVGNNKNNDAMSGITQNTLARIDKWLNYGTSMQTAFPKLDQRYRMQICSEFYKRWVQNKDIDPRTVCRNIARRDYEMFFNQAAQGNKEAQEYVIALRITLDDEGNICPRTVTELNNDFKEDKNEADKMPLMEINITGDVSVIKRDRVNYTDEERKRIARKYGLSEKQVINMIQDSNGTWQMPSEEGDKPKEKDIYELNDDMEDL